LHKVQQRLGGSGCQGSGAIGIGSWRLSRICNEDTPHAQSGASLNIGERIAHHHAIAGIGAREVAEGLLKQPRQGLAAIALSVVVRAIVDGIEMSTVRCEMLLQPVMHDVQIGLRMQSQGDAALVRHQDHPTPGAVEPGDGFLDAGQPFELFPRGDVAAGKMPVQHSVPI